METAWEREIRPDENHAIKRSAMKTKKMLKTMKKDAMINNIEGNRYIKKNNRSDFTMIDR